MNIRTVLAFSLSTSLLIPSLAFAEEQLPVSRAVFDPQIEFPNIDRATRPAGAFVRPENVVMVTPGMTKGQLYTLLDVPHFSEGLFNVRRWNYIFKFYTGEGDAFITCQYQIQFDGDALVSARWWSEQRCADLVNRLVSPPRRVEPQPVAAYVPPVAAPRQAETALKTYFFNFDFDSSSVGNEGHRVLRQVTSDVSDATVSRIVVTGFTDTMGPVDYNDALGARRAAATVSELSSLLSGIFPAAEIYSRSGRDLEINSGDEVRELTNRRVRVELFQ